MKTALCFVLCFSALFPPDSLHAQGSLTPPAGTPAPTMKTLDQIEPRIDIATLGGDASTVRIIPAPGSYYLTGDLAGAAGKDTIRVASGGRVTIDLSGFALTTTGSGRSAILLPAANDEVVIRNGTILATGSTASAAVGGNGTNVLCEELRILSTGGQAIRLGDNGSVIRCRLSRGGIVIGANGVLRETRVESTIDNVSINLGDDAQVTQVTFVTTRGELAVGERGLVSDTVIDSGGPSTFFTNGTVLSASSSSIIRHCTVKGGDTVDNAIQVGPNSLVSHCRVGAIFRDGIRSLGSGVTVESCSVENFGRRAIELGADARVRDCVVTSTGGGLAGITVGNDSIVSGSKVSGSGGTGILATDGCTIVDSSAAANSGDGIQAGNHATIEKCNARGNQGNGIVVGTAGLISDCVVSLNGKKTTPNNAAADGIEISAGRTRIINCTVFSNAQHGINSASVNNRNYIEGCLMHSNGAFAIALQSNVNTVTKNQVAGNTGGTINQTGGGIAPIQFASDPVGTIHPLANFQ